MKVVAVTTISLLLALANFQPFVEAGLLNSLITAVNSTFYNLGNNVSIDLANDALRLPNGDQIGTAALPLNTVCQIPEINPYLVCFVCNNDCIYAHNTYGGTCGPNPLKPGSQTCLCAETPEEAAARGISTDSKTTCNATLYPPAVANLLTDAFFAPAIRIRMKAVQCLKTGNIPNPSGYNNTGCTADCVDNHGYELGTCTTATPKVAASRYAESQPDFCLCSNSANSSTTTTTTTTPAP